MSDFAAPFASVLGGNPNTKSGSDLISIVRFRGDYRNTVRFPNANLLTEIQAAFAEFYGLVVDANEGYADLDDTLTTTANVGYVALPDGAWRVRAIDRLDGTDYEPLMRVGIKDRNRYGTSTDRPTAFRLTARGADLYPTPNAVYTLRITYTPSAPTLDLDTQRTFYNGWEEYVVFGALLRLGGNEHNDAPIWQRALDATRERIQREAPERTASGPEYLNLFGDGDSGDDLDRHPNWSW